MVMHTHATDASKDQTDNAQVHEAIYLREPDGSSRLVDRNTSCAAH